MKRLAVDPGDAHVGWCYGTPDGVDVGEDDPATFTDRYVYLLTRNEVDEIILEEFVLYQNQAEKQTWNDFKTVQLIGALKLVAHWFQVPVVMQGAYVKKPTQGQMRARGIVPAAKGSVHASDAELHYYYRTLRAAKEEQTS